LSSLEDLEYINLLGNPIKNYENKLKELLPNLKEIDVQKDIFEESDIFNNNTLFGDENGNKNIKSSNKIIEKKQLIKENEIEDSKLATYSSTDVKKNLNGENEEVKIVDNNNIIIQELMESKTKFNFRGVNIKDLESSKDLKPVIAKKKEGKEIKILRVSFSRESQKNDVASRIKGNSKNKDMSSNRYRNNVFGSGLKALKNIKEKAMKKYL